LNSSQHNGAGTGDSFEKTALRGFFSNADRRFQIKRRTFWLRMIMAIIRQKLLRRSGRATPAIDNRGSINPIDTPHRLWRRIFPVPFMMPIYWSPHLCGGRGIDSCDGRKPGIK
jgi:hypothetical protein